MTAMGAIEIGSEWYVFGRHYEVVGEGQRDGFPAVLLKPKGWEKPKLPPHSLVFTSRVVQHGVRT